MIGKYSGMRSAWTSTGRARGLSGAPHTDCRLSDMGRVGDRRIVAGERSLGVWLLLLILQKRGLLPIFTPILPVVTHVSTSFQIRRSDRASVFGWKLSRLQETQSTSNFMSVLVRAARFCARSFANVFVRVHEAESCQGDVSGAALRTRACGLVTSETHLLAAGPCMSITCRNVVASHAFPDALTTRVQED